MAKQIVDYQIVHALDHISFPKSVLEYVARGYVPQGGVSTTRETQGTAFTQAVVKYEECSVNNVEDQ